MARHIVVRVSVDGVLKYQGPDNDLFRILTHAFSFEEIYPEQTIRITLSIWVYSEETMAAREEVCGEEAYRRELRARFKAYLEKEDWVC